MKFETYEIEISRSTIDEVKKLVLETLESYKTQEEKARAEKMRLDPERIGVDGVQATMKALAAIDDETGDIRDAAAERLATIGTRSKKELNEKLVPSPENLKEFSETAEMLKLGIATEATLTAAAEKYKENPSARAMISDYAAKHGIDGFTFETNGKAAGEFIENFFNIAQRAIDSECSNSYSGMLIASDNAIQQMMDAYGIKATQSDAQSDEGDYINRILHPENREDPEE